MIIRRALPEDTPQIISLLKQSLGESRILKSEKLWIWKHNENAFGKSEINLAFEGEQLIGVRPFMRWNWKLNSGTLRSLRAVDTAIHPAFQGKGVFSTLTQELIREVEGNYDFIFNTPNKKSRLGYYKMGWKSLGRIPVYFMIKPLNGIGKKKWDPEQEFNIQNVLAVFNNNMDAIQIMMPNAIVSEKTIEIIEWRYLKCPIFSYYAIGELSGDNSYLIIFRIIERFKLKELRIVEFLLHPEFTDNRNFDERFEYLLQHSGANFISMPRTQTLNKKNKVKLITRLFKLKIGPVLTVMRLNSNTPQLNPDLNWFPSFGDLELF